MEDMDIQRGLLNVIGELRELIRLRDAELTEYKNSYASMMSDLAICRDEVRKLKLEIRDMQQLVMATSPDKQILQDS